MAQSTMIEQPCSTSSAEEEKGSGQLSTIIQTCEQYAAEPPGAQSDSKYLELLIAGPSCTNTPDLHHLSSG